MAWRNRSGTLRRGARRPEWAARTLADRAKPDGEPRARCSGSNREAGQRPGRKPCRGDDPHGHHEREQNGRSCAALQVNAAVSSVKGKCTSLDQTAPSGRSIMKSSRPCNNIPSRTPPGIGVGGGTAPCSEASAAARPRTSESEEMNLEHGDRTKEQLGSWLPDQYADQRQPGKLCGGPGRVAGENEEQPMCGWLPDR